MKKFHKDVRSTDRILVKSGPDVLHFYFKSNTAEDYLFTTCYTPGVYQYFKDRGRTVREIYGFSGWDNPRLGKSVSRLPDAVKYVLTCERDVPARSEGLECYI